MSINQFKDKIKGYLDIYKEEILVALVIILVGFGSFGLGKLSVSEKENPAILFEGGKMPRSGLEASVNSAKRDMVEDRTKTTTNGKEQVIASKNGTKYHYPWCSGAKQISDKNKITFNTIEEAKSAGYTPAGNCKGLK